MLIDDCDYVIVSYDVSNLRELMPLYFEICFSDYTMKKTKLLFDEPILPRYLIKLYPSLTETRMINGFFNKSYMLEFQPDFGEEINYLIPMSIFNDILEYTENSVHTHFRNRGLLNLINAATTNEVSEHAVREYHRDRLLSWLEEFN